MVMAHTAMKLEGELQSSNLWLKGGVLYSQIWQFCEANKDYFN